MSGLVTKETHNKVEDFISSIESPSKREDANLILNMISEITGYDPKVWGNDKNPYFIIGFGKYNYKRKGGKEEYEWFRLGFAPRKTKITIYLTSYLNDEKQLLQDLGKCKWGSGCLYINKLADVDLEVLRSLILKCYLKINDL